jgi:hypothetical protein
LSKRPENQISWQEEQPSVLIILPLLPGKTEAWRRFVQELQELKEQAWSAWRKRVGLRDLRVWVKSGPQGAAVFVQASKNVPTGRLGLLVDEREPFDRWLRDQVLALHGLDLARFQRDAPWELVLEA